MGHGCGYIRGASDCGMCGKSNDVTGGFYYQSTPSNNPHRWGWSDYPLNYGLPADTDAIISLVDLLDQAGDREDILENRIKELEAGIEELHYEIRTFQAAAELFEAQRDAAREQVDLAMRGDMEAPSEVVRDENPSETKRGGPLDDGDYYPSKEKIMRNNPAR